MHVPNSRFLLNRPLAGWAGKWALVVRPYDASEVICQDNPPAHPFEDKCDWLVQSIPAGVDQEDTFGPDGAPGVTAPVPWVEETHCKILGFASYCQY